MTTLEAQKSHDELTQLARALTEPIANSLFTVSAEMPTLAQSLLFNYEVMFTLTASMTAPLAVLDKTPTGKGLGAKYGALFQLMLVHRLTNKKTTLADDFTSALGYYEKLTGETFPTSGAILNWLKAQQGKAN